MTSEHETDRDPVARTKRAFAYKLFFQQGVLPFNASLNDYFLAVSATLRDRMQGLFINSVAALRESKSRIVCYFSAEFLMGPHLENNLLSLGLRDEFARAAEEAGLDLQQIIDHEEEPGLGNGGLGRLAACYLDSLATLQIPGLVFRPLKETREIFMELNCFYLKDEASPLLRELLQVVHEYRKENERMLQESISVQA